MVNVSPDGSRFAIFVRQGDLATVRSDYATSGLAYKVFEHVSDPKALAAAIKAVKYNMESSGKDHPVETDTYANLLYKGGRNKEAVEWQKKAVQLSEGRDKEIVDHLEQMKVGQPSWQP